MSFADDTVELMNLVSSGSSILPGLKVKYSIENSEFRDQYFFSASTTGDVICYAQMTMNGIEIHQASGSTQDAISLIEHIVTALRKQLLKELTR